MHKDSMCNILVNPVADISFFSRLYGVIQNITTENVFSGTFDFLVFNFWGLFYKCH